MDCYITLLNKVVVIFCCCLFVYLVCMGGLSSCLSDPLEEELQTVVIHYVCSGNQTWPLRRTACPPNAEGHLCSPVIKIILKCQILALSGYAFAIRNASFHSLLSTPVFTNHLRSRSETFRLDDHTLASLYN